MNFQNAKIYKIVDSTNGNKYIGSTTGSIEEELREHESNYKKCLNEKCYYKASFDIITNGDYFIELIEDFPCNDKKQLNDRKEYWIKQYNYCVNERIGGRTAKQYHKYNIDEIKKYNKQYREDNQEKIKQYYLKQKLIDFQLIVVSSNLNT